MTMPGIMQTLVDLQVDIRLADQIP